MPSYKLTYFNLRGRGEIARYIFAHAGQKYENNTIPFGSDEWLKFKPTTIFGQVPLLEVDGREICQSNAINRYLAKQFGLYGNDDWESARIDMVMDCMEDLFKPMAAFLACDDEKKKEQMKQKYEDEELPKFMRSLEQILCSNGNGKHFVGNKLSVADIQCAHFLTFPDGRVKLDLHKYPKVEALKKMVENESRIKAWIDKRPPASI